MFRSEKKAARIFRNHENPPGSDEIEFYILAFDSPARTVTKNHARELNRRVRVTTGEKT